jgi:hypothetical protein
MPSRQTRCQNSCSVASLPDWQAIPVGLQHFGASSGTDDFARASISVNDYSKVQATRGFPDDALEARRER